MIFIYAICNIIQFLFVSTSRYTVCVLSMLINCIAWPDMEAWHDIHDMFLLIGICVHMTSPR